MLIRSGGNAARFAREDALTHALQLPYKVALSTKGAGTYYYLCRLEVSTLNDTDLREVEQWLKGEVTPAVSGQGGSDERDGTWGAADAGADSRATAG